jgi:hypothetical protein
VARGICYSMSANLIINSTGLPLSDDLVAVQSVDLLREEDVPFE